MRTRSVTLSVHMTSLLPLIPFRVSACSTCKKECQASFIGSFIFVLSQYTVPLNWNWRTISTDKVEAVELGDQGIVVRGKILNWDYGSVDLGCCCWTPHRNCWLGLMLLIHHDDLETWGKFGVKIFNDDWKYCKIANSCFTYWN